MKVVSRQWTAERFFEGNDVRDQGWEKDKYSSTVINFYDKFEEQVEDNVACKVSRILCRKIDHKVSCRL